MLVAAASLSACGEDAATADNAVEAREENTVQLAGVRYRVVSFRELNVRAEPDDALWDGPPPKAGHGLFAVVVRACAAGDVRAPMSDEIHLEDAFGDRFPPRPDDTADEFEYQPTELGPGDCRPEPGSAADRTFDGSVLVFDVPFESTAERPMILEIQDPDGVRDARIQLDL
jgi:hypothetical protein